MNGRNQSYGARTGSLDQRIRTLAQQYSELERLRDLVRKAEANDKKRRRSAILASKARSVGRCR